MRIDPRTLLLGAFAAEKSMRDRPTSDFSLRYWRTLFYTLLVTFCVDFIVVAGFSLAVGGGMGFPLLVSVFVGMIAVAASGLVAMALLRVWRRVLFRAAMRGGSVPATAAWMSLLTLAGCFALGALLYISAFAPTFGEGFFDRDAWLGGLIFVALIGVPAAAPAILAAPITSYAMFRDYHPLRDKSPALKSEGTVL